MNTDPSSTIREIDDSVATKGGSGGGGMAANYCRSSVQQNGSGLQNKNNQPEVVVWRQF